MVAAASVGAAGQIGLGVALLVGVVLLVIRRVRRGRQTLPGPELTMDQLEKAA